MARTVIATLILMLSAQAASAGTLYSPPVTLKQGQGLECKITNLGGKPIQVDIGTPERRLGLR